MGIRPHAAGHPKMHQQRMQSDPKAADQKERQQQLEDQGPAGHRAEVQANHLLYGVRLGAVPVDDRQGQQPEIADNENAGEAEHGKQQDWEEMVVAERQADKKEIELGDRKSTRLNSSHANISYA